VEFGFIARSAPVGVVQLLFAASRIASGGLKMPVLRRANPNAAIGRRNCEIGEAFAFRKAENGLSIIVKIRKALTSLAAANSWGIITTMVQSGRHCRCMFHGWEGHNRFAMGHFSGCFWFCALQGRAARAYGSGGHELIVALKSLACIVSRILESLERRLSSKELQNNVHTRC